MTYGLKSNKTKVNTQYRKPKVQVKSKSISAPSKKKSPVKTTKTAVEKTAVKKKVQSVAAVREAKPKVHTVKAVTYIPMPVAIIVLAVIFTSLFMLIIFSFVNINEFTIKNDALEIKISKLEKEYKELSLSLERKNNLREIERYAKEELGMVKLDQLEKQYITINNQDKIEVIDNKKSAQDILSGFFENINKNIKNLVEYIE